jgi:hypothetical protein
MNVTDALVMAAGWLATVAKEGWNWLPAEWRAPTAIIALVGSLFTVYRAWHYRRRLDIELVPNSAAEDIARAGHYYLFNLTITNPAKSANSVRAVQCTIDSERLPFTVQPRGMLSPPIVGGATVYGSISLPSTRVLGMGGHEHLKFMFTLVHGRRTSCEFSKDDLLPES